MLTNLIFEMYELDSLLYYNFSNPSISKKISLIEEKNLKKFSITTLKTLEEVIGNILNKLDSFYKEDFEIAFENNDTVIILRRMYNQILKTINNFRKDENGKLPLFSSLYTFYEGEVIYVDDLGGSLNNLTESVICDIETKFMVFLLSNPLIDDDIKKRMAYNMVYINPYLDDKVSDRSEKIYNSIIKEEEEYNNLDGIMKETYDNYLEEYSFSVLKDLFYLLLTDISIKDDQLKMYEIYIRTIFNNLKEEDLESLNYSFNEINVNVLNKEGEEAIRKAFRSIRNDKDFIKKIKNIK